MASAITSHPVAIKEYLKFKAPAGYRDELVYGRIIVSPEPKPLHFDIADNIYKLLCSAAGKQFKVAQRVNLCFPALASMPSPDVFVMSHEAWKKARDANGYPDGTATIFAVEVLSPGNRKKAVESKVELYQEHGIEFWVVNPKTQKVKIVREPSRYLASSISRANLRQRTHPQTKSKLSASVTVAKHSHLRLLHELDAYIA